MVGVFAERNIGLVAGLAALGSLAVFGSAAVLLTIGFSGSFFGGGYVVDGFALYFKLIVAGSAFFAILAAARWSGYTGDEGEYLTLILSVVLGSLLLVSMRDLFGLFLAIELATIPSYAMVAFDRSRRESAEGGMKYLITGVIASSVLLYGIVLIYGVAGSASLTDVAEAFSGGLSPVAVVGLVLLISGFAFKVSAAPFHFWTPDAYQGAPTSAAAFLSVAPKAAFFAILLRVLLEGMPEAAPTWTAVMAFLSILTMFVGNLFALRQSNVRRMLAYSSVAHSGYILAAFAALQGQAVPTAVEAILIYSAAYAVMNLGAFLVIDLVGEDTKELQRPDQDQPRRRPEHGRLHGFPRRDTAVQRLLREGLDHPRRSPVGLGAGLRGRRSARRQQRPLRPVLLRHYPQHVLRGTGRAREGRRRSREVLRLRPRPRHHPVRPPHHPPLRAGPGLRAAVTRRGGAGGFASGPPFSVVQVKT